MPATNEILRSIDTKIYPHNEEDLKAILRTYVVVNLTTAYYCGHLRWMLRGADHKGTTLGDAAYDVANARILNQKSQEFLVAELKYEKDLAQWSKANKAGTAKAKKTKTEWEPPPRPIKPKWPKKDPSKLAGALYSPLTSTDSKACGLGDLDLDMVRRVQSNPYLIEQPDICHSVRPNGGVAPAWMVPMRDSKGKTIPHHVQVNKAMEDLQKAVDKWANKLIKEADPTNPLRVLVREGWSQVGNPYRMLPLEEMLEPLGAATRTRNLTGSYGRHAFARAAAHLSQVESARTEHRKTVMSLEAQAKQILSAHGETPEWETLTKYEQDSAAHFEATSGYVAKNPYQLGHGGEMKGWGKIRKRWLEILEKDPEATAETLQKARLKIQKRDPENHGDHRLFDWAILPSNRSTWSGDTDFLSQRVRYNRLQRHPRVPGFSWPCPLQGPLPLQWGPKTALKYKGILTGHQGDTTSVKRGEITFPVFVEGQRYRSCTFEVGTTRLDEDMMLDKKHKARIGGVSVSIPRQILNRVDTSCLPEPGKPISWDSVNHIVEALFPYVVGKPLQMSLAVYLETLSPSKTLSGALHGSLQKRFGIKPDKLSTLVDTCVLGVDLGMRFGAAITAGRIVPLTEINGSPYRQIPDTKLGMVFERSAILRLPGETPGATKALDPLWDQIGKVRQAVGLQNRAAKWVKEPDPETTRAQIKELFEDQVTDNTQPGDLLRQCDQTSREEMNTLLQLDKSFRCRRHTGGLSFRRLDTLDAIHDCVRRFSTRQRPWKGRITSQRKGRGFDSRRRGDLLEMKRERARLLASMIVEAALGGPQGKHPQASLICMEDLSGFTTSSDNSRRTNRTLTKWCKQETLKNVKALAAFYGIVVLEVNAAWTSQYHALTGSPCARVGVVKKYFEGKQWWERLKEQDRRFDQAQVGEQVPLKGGSLVLDISSGHLSNADTNAAANIAFRGVHSLSSDKALSMRLTRDDEGVYRDSQNRVALIPHPSRTGMYIPATQGTPTPSKGPKKVFVVRDLTGTVGAYQWYERGTFWGMARNIAWKFFLAQGGQLSEAVSK